MSQLLPRLLFPASAYISRPKVRKDPFILSLDERILAKIYQYLPLVDQICLSISCNKLFGLFGAIVKHKDFTVPRLLSIRVPILCSSSKDVPRNQLLLRLENHRWAFCARCLKLHPRYEFEEDTLKDPPLRRACTSWAGIVDLCPCISLTVRERWRVIQYLRSSTPGITQYGPFRFEFTRDEKPKLLHNCSTGTKAGGKVDFILTLSLNVSGELALSTQYTLQLLPLDDYLKAEPFFTCPHQGLLPFEIPVGVQTPCPTCVTHILILPEHEDETKVNFTMGRILGRMKSPDEAWFVNCRLGGIRYLDIEKYWYWSHEFQKKMRGIHGQWHAEFCIELKRLVNEYRRSRYRRSRDLENGVGHEVLCGLYLRSLNNRLEAILSEVKRIGSSLPALSSSRGTQTL